MKPVKKAAVFFDLDGTWLRWQLFDEWVRKAVELGVLPLAVRQLAEEKRQAYLARRGSFADFAQAQVQAYQSQSRLRGVRVSDAEFAAQEVLREMGHRVHLFTQKLALAAKAAHMERIIISGSIREAVQAFARANDVSIYFGTEEPQVDGFYTGGQHIAWTDRKDEAVKNVAAEHKIDLGVSVAIGDTLSDAKMLELVGYPICFNPSLELLGEARARHWPVVWEKKDAIVCFQTDPASDLLRERDVVSILPQPLDIALTIRLA